MDNGLSIVNPRSFLPLCRLVLVLAISLALTPGCEQSEVHVGESLGELPLWELEERFEIGSYDEPGHDLTEVSSVAVSPHGRVYVAQSSDPGVRMFEAESGAYIDRFGREGSGPGEFQRVSVLGFQGDTVWASEPGWVHRFSLVGEHLSSERIRFQPPPPSGAGAVAPLSDGWGLMTPTVMMFGPGPPRSTEVPRYLVDLGNDEAHEIPGVEPVELVEVGRIGGQPVVVQRPFTGYDASARAQDGTSVLVIEQDRAGEAAPDTFRALRLGAAGDTLQAAELTYLPIPIAEYQVEDAIATEARAVAEAFASYNAALGAVRSGLKAPEHFLPVSRILPADDGTVWLASFLGSGSPWVILDSDLTPIARLAPPPADLEPIAVAADALWATRVDEAGWTRLVRMDLVRHSGDPRP